MTGRYYAAGQGYVTGAQPFTVSSYYKPSSTGWQNLTVQQNFVLSWPLTLPTEALWYRPASPNNRGWWPVLGAYPGTGYNGHIDPLWDTRYPDTNPTWNNRLNFHPYVPAPNSAHILRYRQDVIGGLIGGPAQQFTQLGTPSMPDCIYAGRIYDTRSLLIDGTPTNCAYCSDLRTGEVYYAIPTSEGGQTPNMVTYLYPEARSETTAGQELGNQRVTVELLRLSGSTLYKINADTGSVSNYTVLSGSQLMNQVGGYFVAIQNLGNEVPEEQRYRLINWTSRGSSQDIADRVISNTSYAQSSFPTYVDWESGYAARVNAPLIYGPFSNSRWLLNFVSYDAYTGVMLHNVTTDQWPDISYHSSPIGIDHGMVAAWASGGYYVIFDCKSGNWFRTEGTDYPWSSAGGFGAYSWASAYGMVYRFAYDGVYAFNWTTGERVWKYEAPAEAPFESPYNDGNGTSVYSFNAGCTIADGKMYIYNTEHTETYPLTRGWGIHCINITTGEGIWKLNNPMRFGGMADGYMTFGNRWDGTMYVIGPGPSKTTVTAPDVAVPLGTSVVIKGTVLDQSPAQPDTACVAKDSMSLQMQYLHLGQPIGGLWNNETVFGVPVYLSAIDSNGNPIDLGSVTSNGYSGVYSLTWTPPAEGDYEIIATFAGDDSYGSSMSTTTVSVGPAPAEINIPETPTPVDNSMLLYGILVAVIIAIVLAVIALVVIFQKR